MTIEEFKQLSIENQIQLLESHAGPISLRQSDEYTIVLRKINDFFVEAYYKIFEGDKIAEVKVFDSIDDLLPWVFKLAPKPVHRSAPK
jgi:hypothetical protein